MLQRQTVLQRQGLGKTWHIQVQYMWIRGEVSEGRLAVKKENTDKTLADIPTTALNKGQINIHMKVLHFKVDDSRADAARRLSCKRSERRDGQIAKTVWLMRGVRTRMPFSAAPMITTIMLVLRNRSSRVSWLKCYSAARRSITHATQVSSPAKLSYFILDTAI